MEKEVKTEIIESQAKDICFIITPIGEDGSAIRRKADGLIDNVLGPVCNELGLKAIPAHNIDKIGSITNQVVQHVLESKMVIANLTGLNPNVMYELAIRHASKKPVVCIAEDGTKLPFDITTERTIFYSDDMYGAIRLRSDLKDKLLVALSDVYVDNPIYRAIKESSIIKEIQSNNGNWDSLLYILERLNNIETAIRRNFNSSLDSSSSDFNDFLLKLSKPCTSISSEIIDFIENYPGNNGIFDYVINDNQIEFYSYSNDFLPFFKKLSKFLDEKFQIKIVAVDNLVNGRDKFVLMKK